MDAPAQPVTQAKPPAAQPEAPQRINRLAIRLGTAAYLLEMTSVGEIVPLPSVTPVPWTRPWFRGLANVRGRLIGVYDLPQLAGGEPMTDEQALQLLVVSDAMKAQVALLATRAFGLRDLNQMQQMPRLAAARPWEGDRYRDADGTVMTEIDLARLVRDEAFGAIGA
jgi:twitching motility protein PilI